MNSYKAIKLELLSEIDYWKILESWPTDEKLLTVGGQGSEYKMISLDFDLVSPDELLDFSICVPSEIPNPDWPQFYQYVGCVSFEEFTSLETNEPSQVFKVSCAIIFRENQVWLAYGSSISLNEARVRLDRTISRGKPSETVTCTSKWVADRPTSEYIEAARACIEDIKKGRYYQINLLRYFSLEGEVPCWFSRFRRFSGPFGCWVKHNSLELISFSPERFIAVQADQTAVTISTEPIKGTSAVYEDPIENQKSKDFLTSSVKDHAELHMIVDLMRNDLNRVCESGTVVVEEENSLHSFKHVHHLIARVRGVLRSPTTVKLLLMAVCPGGSITGAPKIEVCKAIREYEARDRGFFMGNIICLDPVRMTLDSSILIRTAYKSGEKSFSFAAGSGLTINSDPDSEAYEISTKCKVITEN